jgi:hypothetical protein
MAPVLVEHLPHPLRSPKPLLLLKLLWLRPL